MKLRILLVEDNPADVYLIREALRASRLPHDLQVAYDGRQALRMLFECNTTDLCPDLVLLDLNLPLMNGHEVLHVLKEDERTRTVPVIIMSSSDAEDDVSRAYESHANCYVQKPKDLDDLFHIIRAIQKFWLETAKLPRPSPLAPG